MIDIRPTRRFANWLRGLRDRRAFARIVGRLDRLAEGHFGDIRDLGEGIAEMRIDYGPGYRLYFMRRGNAVVVLLAGGDKSTQSRDIAAARQAAREIDHG